MTASGNFVKVLIVGVLFIGALLVLSDFNSHMSRKNLNVVNVRESFSGDYAADGSANAMNDATNAVGPSEPLASDNETSDKVNYESTGATTCFPRDNLGPEDLIPKNQSNSKWSQMNPAGQGELNGKNYLDAGHHWGVDTIGSSLRNANMGLRSEPPNPQVQVSPWMNTTMEPDLNRRPLEINGDF
jgi:hypothetical protein